MGPSAHCATPFVRLSEISCVSYTADRRLPAEIMNIANYSNFKKIVRQHLAQECPTRVNNTFLTR